jgi:PIN domain nuclease of toxin-antitoxin system
MKLLVDTHVFLWSVISPEKLSAKARSALENPANEVFLSAVTLWEISLKSALGKLDLEGATPAEMPDAAIATGYRLLPLHPEVAAGFFQLPRREHKDPFDRMLIWQAMSEGFLLVSKDPHVRLYAELGLKALW